jgi:hypothetical protein
MPWDELVRTLGSGGTLVAVLIAAQQLLLNRRQIRASFEDDLSREYRALSVQLPADAFFDDADRSVQMTGEQQQAMLRYFDLSNEQLRYCEQRRVSRSTAKAWREGIEENLRLPRFEQAWEAITPRLGTDHFTELYKLRPPVPVRVTQPSPVLSAQPSVSRSDRAPQRVE